MTFADIVAAVLKLTTEAIDRPCPDVHTVLVAEDVWQTLLATTSLGPTGPGSINVLMMPELAPGTWLPVDRDGKPLTKGGAPCADRPLPMLRVPRDA